ncbi:MAG: alpha/beta fold hydrolase [Micropruina sp.]|nr:MAG: alpha/beta fold hydrolase [Micropruina sp.]
MRLHSQLVGHGRPDVVFLHGLFGRGKNWNGIARELAAEDHASVLVDLPNHGRSSWTESFDYVTIADQVAEELELRLGSAAAVNLVGHSMGGKVAMLVALRHPELVTRLAVVDIAPAVSEQVVTSVPLVRAMRSLDLVGTRDRAGADAALAADVDDPAVRAFLLQNLKHVRHPEPGEARWRWEVNLDLLGDALPDVAAWPDVHGTYPGPVLWLAGELSPYVRVEHQATMSRLFPRVELVRVPGAGHWVHADAPEATVAALRRLLQRRVRS